MKTLQKAQRLNLSPPPVLSLSQWAERYAYLSKETSAQTGRFEAYAYQVGMMDAITDPKVEKVSVMKSARVGYTKILDHIVGYYMHQDPSPILVVQPRVEDAEDYSKSEIAPMLRDTTVLAEIAPDPKTRSGENTLLKKTMKNGASIALVGANSPGGFRRITVRIVLFDEVDGYPVGGAGSEGDQIALGTKRSETFWNRKIVAGSTPTIKGLSRIEKLYQEGDQRKFYVPCPHCGEFQILEWGGKDVTHGIKWDKDERGNALPDTAHYVCQHNGCVIEEKDKPDLIKEGEWRANAPFKGHASFHINSLYSLMPNARWSLLVAEFLRVKSDPIELQTFVNTMLGETFEDRGEGALSELTLARRAEVWAGEVPDGVVLLTAAGDTQDDRVELEIVGWGRNEERWSIAHIVIDGDPDGPALWQEVDTILKRQWYRADGHAFSVMATCIDSGGHHTQKVYEFCKARLGRRIWAIKGESARGGQRSPVWPAKRPTRKSKGFRPYIIGVNTAKDTIRARLALEQPPPNTACPGYMHYPQDRDVNFFAQLVSERSVRTYIGGRYVRIWEQTPGRANEALDLAVYSYAALCGLMQQGVKLNALADRMEQNHEPLKMVEQKVEVSGLPKEDREQVDTTDPEKKRRAFKKLFL
ncbi:phage terminase large subunit family protein [Commensalibacter oyaizuii]|uniref:Phage terminase large subunit family protein n=1 Tax=Commensalibacter oyaizuii TaxID=3043873 RepID=A0ABT6Q3B0_9PROT|nr:phage terminase large subunit family protein [Commensalibacter sp. TBRC 16381]MDI2091609.1 phage terminase large subunit family protein [Commensalibacter sp. TBRC 16381]